MLLAQEEEERLDEAPEEENSTWDSSALCNWKRASKRWKTREVSILVNIFRDDNKKNSYWSDKLKYYENESSFRESFEKDNFKT